MGMATGQGWGWNCEYIYKSQKKWEMPQSTIFKLEGKLEIDRKHNVRDGFIKSSHKGDIEDITL